MCSHVRPLLLAIALSTLAMCSIAWSANANASSSGHTVASKSAATLPDVTVTAPRPPDPQELAGDAVPNFITSHATPSTVIHQLARWRTGICPVTQGLSPAFNAFVSARIEAVATAVGAPHQAAEKCEHNIRIIFATEPQKVLDEVVKQQSQFLGFHYSNQTKKLATFSRPAQGWYVTSTRGDAGDEAIDEPLPLPSVPNYGLAGPVPAGRLGSRLVTGQSSAIINALIVVDVKKIVGHAIGPISDYLAVLVLSQSQSSDTCGVLPSILDLMSSTCGDRKQPTQVTAGDLAFLRGLYSANLEQPVFLETSDIQNRMMREFGRR